MSEPEIAKKVEAYLNEIDYGNDVGYMPSDFTLEFVTFIKLVNGEDQSNKTPVVHLKMLDMLVMDNGLDTINMCHRGIAKSTLKEYLILYIGVYGEIPGFGKVPYALYVSDSIENGVKKMRKSLEYRWNNSEFLQLYIPTVKFTDVRWEFINALGKSSVVSGYGAQALALDTPVVMEDGTHKNIGDIQVQDRVMTPRGHGTTVIAKSQVFNRRMYEILLEDSRTLKVCEEHLNSVVIKNPNTGEKVGKVLPTKELLTENLQHVRTRKRYGLGSYISRENLVFIENTLPIATTKNIVFSIDPYTLGLLLGDGSMRKDDSNILHAHKDDLPEYLVRIPYITGIPYLDKRNNNVTSTSIKGISSRIRSLGVNVHGNFKFIPELYKQGSIAQRLELLKGLMDSDGSIYKNGRMSFTSKSELLIDGVSTIVRSLGGTVKKAKTNNKRYSGFRIEIWISVCPFHLQRKVVRFTGIRVKELVAIKSIREIPIEPSQCIRVMDGGHEFLVGDYIRTHNTGVRGTRENGSRPVLALLDDLVSDQDAKSATAIQNIEDTVYKAIDYALDPTRRKVIWSGTPFNARDPLYKAVESGAYNVNVYPICNKFPCTREEFRGSWEDRFSYDYVLQQYTKARKTGKLADFNQELMLRIMSDEERLIQDVDINWYKLALVMGNRNNFNFYITTDFATSEKTSSDFSVISVWAINNNGDWYWVDGVCKKQLMDANINDLFLLAQRYKPQSVGIEVSGQQGGFIPWIKDQMLVKNIFFALASDNNAKAAGIRPTTNKMERFNVVLPLFKMGKMFFPMEKKDSIEMIECMDELTLTTKGAFRSKNDDFIDTISMLSNMGAWKPSNSEEAVYNDSSGVWEEETKDNNCRISSYIV